MPAEGHWLASPPDVRSRGKFGSTGLAICEPFFKLVAFSHEHAHGTRQRPPAVHFQTRNDLAHKAFTPGSSARF